LVTATFLVVATCLAVKFLEMELRGPIWYILNLSSVVETNQQRHDMTWQYSIV
jgi:hypothetical protein